MNFLVTDISPLINLGITFAAPIVAGAGAWVAYKIGTYFHLKGLETIRPLVQSAIENGIGLLQKQLGSTPINVNDTSHIEQVVAYVNATVPGALTKLGISPNALGQKVAAEIAKAT